MNPSIAIVVLNWNNARDTVACLDSLAQLDYPNPWIIVVDNGSTDDSVARIRAAHSGVTLLETGANLGYAGGNNVGVKHALAAGADYVCILNNDVVVEPGFLAPLLAALDANERAGVATPMIVEMQDVHKVWSLGAEVDWTGGSVQRLYTGQPVTELVHRAPFEVSIAPGSAMLVKRRVFERTGLLDDKYFLYFEEADWCIAVRKAGFRILAVPEARVMHYVSATLGQSSPVTDYYMTRNQIHFIRRHWNGLRRSNLLTRTCLRQVAALAAFTLDTHDGQRLPHRAARFYALRDALLDRWGKMGDDVAKVCYPNRL